MAHELEKGTGAADGEEFLDDEDDESYKNPAEQANLDE